MAEPLTPDPRERLVEFDRPTHRQSVMSLGQIIGRLEDSV